jgi:hypothetical protein
MVQRWLAKDLEDGKIRVDVSPQDVDGRASLPSAKYKVTTTTGKVKGAGTDANVFIIISGKK